MATAKDFARLDEIEGVFQYILVRDDGQVISENTQDAAQLSKTIINSGKQLDSLTNDLSGKRYIYCSVERTSGQSILIFSLGLYFLAIVKHPDSDPQQLADTIIVFLKSLP
jgi:hypothetical protein